MDSLLNEWLMCRTSAHFGLLKALFRPFRLVEVCAETASPCAIGYLASLNVPCFMRCLCGGRYRSCSRNPSESILARVKKLGQTFKEHYSLDSEDMPGSHIGTDTNGCSPAHNCVLASYLQRVTCDQHLVASVVPLEIYLLRKKCV